MTETVYHTPALLIPCMEGLDIKADGIYVDVTFGGGGHSKEILKRLGKNGRLIAFDQDADAMANIPTDERLTFVRSNFRYLTNWLRYHNIDKVDGILADLGVSFHHFDDSSRGFSFRFDSALDMRMNAKASLTAGKVINEYSEEKLADVLYYFGELKNARKIASLLVKTRSNKTIETTDELTQILEPCFGKDKQKKELTKVFQAIRIEVNHEMDALKQLLGSTTESLKPGGRLVVLTYHSLEDRLVKNFMKSGNFEGNVEQDFYGNRLSPFKLINNKVIVPDEDEIERNPRSRSAKLRIAELSPQKK